MAFTLVFAALATLPVVCIAQGGLADGGGISELKVCRLCQLVCRFPLPWQPAALRHSHADQISSHLSHPRQRTFTAGAL
jgi:hypothetical protein